MSVSSTGTCTRFSASAIGGNLQRRITSGLIHSGRSGSFCSACAIARRSEPSARPFGQGIDGIDAGQLCETGLIHDAVGMHDLQDAVEHLRGAGDVALGADRQQLFDIAGLGAEIGQHDVAGVVAGIDQMRRARVARRRRTVAVDRHLQRDDGSRHRVADFRPRAAIDHARRQMQQQIDQPRRLIAAEQIAEQLVLLRPDAGKARDRRKQRIEQSRAHRNLLVVHNPSCADLTRASILFKRAMDCRVKPGNDNQVDNSGRRLPSKSFAVVDGNVRATEQEVEPASSSRDGGSHMLRRTLFTTAIVTCIFSRFRCGRSLLPRSPRRPAVVQPATAPSLTVQSEYIGRVKARENVCCGAGRGLPLRTEAVQGLRSRPSEDQILFKIRAANRSR